MGIKYRSPGKWSAFGTDANGNLVPGSGYKLYTYVPGTTTNKATYLDKNGASSQTNPVVFDSRGEATIFWNGTYDLKLTDNNDVQIWTLSDFGAGEDYVNYGNYNLVSDGGFEDDTNGDGLPDQWTVTTYPTAGSGAGSAVLDTTTQIEGLYALKFTSQGDGGGYAVSGFFNVREGSVLGLSWQMQSTSATVRNLVEIIWYTSVQIQISTSTIYDASSGNPTTWTEETGNATVPSTARFAKIRVTGCHSSVATTGSTWFDDVYVINNKTFSSSQLLANNVALEGEDTGGTARNLAKVDSSDIATFGDTNLNTLLNFSNYTKLGDSNFYLVSIGVEHYFASNAYYDGINWICGPENTEASILQLDRNSLTLYYNSGLTIGSSFTPYVILGIDNTGKITVGNIDSANVTNLPGTRGALVYKSSNQTIGSLTLVTVAFDSESYDTSLIHDTVTNNDRLTVPTGITKVRLKGFIYTTGIIIPSGENVNVYITKNDTASYVGFSEDNQIGAQTVQQFKVETPILNVTSGDYFSIYVNNAMSATSVTIYSGTGGSSFFMEIIE